MAFITSRVAETREKVLWPKAHQWRSVEVAGPIGREQKVCVSHLRVRTNFPHSLARGRNAAKRPTKTSSKIGFWSSKNRWYRSLPTWPRKTTGESSGFFRFENIGGTGWEYGVCDGSNCARQPMRLPTGGTCAKLNGRAIHKHSLAMIMDINRETCCLAIVKRHRHRAHHWPHRCSTLWMCAYLFIIRWLYK